MSLEQFCASEPPSAHSAGTHRLQWFNPQSYGPESGVSPTPNCPVAPRPWSSLCSQPDPVSEGWHVWPSLRCPLGTGRCRNSLWEWDFQTWFPFCTTGLGVPAPHQSLAPPLSTAATTGRGWRSGKEGPGCTSSPFRPRALIWKQAQCWAFRRAWVWTWGISRVQIPLSARLRDEGAGSERPASSLSRAPPPHTTPRAHV